MKALRQPLTSRLNWSEFALLAPSLFTGARFIASIMLLSVLLTGDWGFQLYLFACTTDILDGFFARRLGSETRIGSMLDASADFSLVTAASCFLIMDGLVSLWFLVLIMVAFAQFVIVRPTPDSDPLGKNIGTVLFVSLGVAIAYPNSWVVSWSTLVASVYIITSLTIRWITFRTRSHPIARTH